MVASCTDDTYKLLATNCIIFRGELRSGEKHNCPGCQKEHEERTV